MRRPLIIVAILALAGLPAGAAAAPSGEWATESSISSVGSTSGSSGESGARAPVAGESDSFRLTKGGISWPSGPTVEYRITNAPFPAAVAAVDAAVATLDQYITTRTFARVTNPTGINPCSGQPNTITWAPLDGPGGQLAFADTCYNTKTKEIAGFTITFDSAEQWVIGLDGDPNTFDVQSVATHEMGNVAGLSDVKKTADQCLTMFAFSTGEEIQKRTLGLGDKLGLDKLYAHGDTTPGPGCGA